MTSTVAKADELAAAALGLFATRSISRVSMDDVAAAAGVTKGSLYWHYSSKQELILAACDRYYARWREEMQGASMPRTSALGMLDAAIEISVRSCLFDVENRVFTTEIVAMSLNDPDVRASWAGFLVEVERFFSGLLHRAVGAGQLDCTDVDGTVTLLIAAMEGLKQLVLFRPHDALSGREHIAVAQLRALVGRRTLG